MGVSGCRIRLARDHVSQGSETGQILLPSLRLIPSGARVPSLVSLKSQSRYFHPQKSADAMTDNLKPAALDRSSTHPNLKVREPAETCSRLRGISVIGLVADGSSFPSSLPLF